MKYLLFVAFLFLVNYTIAQDKTIDKIIAIVGDEIILKSDIENSLLEFQMQRNMTPTQNMRDEALESKLVEKLLLAQAALDSIVVSDSDVENELNANLEDYVRQAGSIEQLERFMGKSYDFIRNDMRNYLKTRMISREMQKNILKGVRATPSEVRHFYRRLNKDSIPDVPDKYEIQQIVIKPIIPDTEKERIRTRLREFRDDINEGKQTFNTLAVMYSEDPGSAIKGGELGYAPKNAYVPEFAEAAFTLKPGRLSKIIETEFGFHLIQHIDRQGDKVNVRHILMRPRVGEQERQEALHYLDTVRNYIVDGEFTFEELAPHVSTDKQSRNNGGLISNAEADSRLSKAEIEGEMARQVDRLKVGEISQPFVDRNANGSEEYKIIKIKAFYPAHKANLEDDWSYFENLLLESRQEEVFEKWIKQKISETYISIDRDYRNSDFRYRGWVK